ncbi:MAG: hypothetical protein H7839_19430 [Magnetococcus sp. YQC-5]
MSDNAKRYRAVKDKLTKLYPSPPRGNVAIHLNTLAGMVSGIVGGKSVNSPNVAAKVPDGNKPASREKQYSRWLNNQRIDFECYFLPFVEIMLGSLTDETLIFAIDGSVTGRGCMTLMASVTFQGRALPVTWVVVKGKKGHMKEYYGPQFSDSVISSEPSSNQKEWI